MLLLFNRLQLTWMNHNPHTVRNRWFCPLHFVWPTTNISTHVLWYRSEWTNIQPNTRHVFSWAHLPRALNLPLLLWFHSFIHFFALWQYNGIMHPRKKQRTITWFFFKCVCVMTRWLDSRNQISMLGFNHLTLDWTRAMRSCDATKDIVLLASGVEWSFPKSNC